MSPYLKIRLSLLHCFAFDFAPFLHFEVGQLTILKRWWSMSGFKEWKGRDWFGFSPFPLCALKLNILKVVAAGTWAEESFCALINPSIRLDYTSIVRRQERSSNSFLNHFPFQWVFISHITESWRPALKRSDKEFDAHSDNTIQRAITNIDVPALKKARGLSAAHIWVFHFLSTVTDHSCMGNNFSQVANSHWHLFWIVSYFLPQRNSWISAGL